MEQVTLFGVAFAAMWVAGYFFGVAQSAQAKKDMTALVDGVEARIKDELAEVKSGIHMKLNQLKEAAGITAAEAKVNGVFTGLTAKENAVLRDVMKL